MTSLPLDSLICDLVEWCSRSPRTVSEALEAWRTSCPRLTVWEDAIERGFLQRNNPPDGPTQVLATAEGLAFLAKHRSPLKLKTEQRRLPA